MDYVFWGAYTGVRPYGVYALTGGSVDFDFVNEEPGLLAGADVPLG